MTAIRIGLVGTGNIAETHAAAIKALSGLEITAVADPIGDRAGSFARRWNVGRLYPTAEAMLASEKLDAVHILVPPPLHMAMATLALDAGVDAFLEKPMAQSAIECIALQEAATRGGAALQINHNFVHHPAHVTMKELLAAKRIGQPRHVVCRFNVALRQLGARQLGHWMFNSPLNLLLEQAIHPLSQIDDLLGPAKDVAVLAAPPLCLDEGQEVHRTWLIGLNCERGTAQLHLSLGESFPIWNISVSGEDGSISADYIGNTVQCDVNGRYPDPIDHLRRAAASGASTQWQAVRNFGAYCAAMLKLRGRSDPFFLSMRRSIDGFYRARVSTRNELNGGQGRRLVELCERIVEKGGLRTTSLRSAKAVRNAVSNYDVLVIGGTGFIGGQVVSRLLAEGRQIGVLARSTANLPQIFNDSRIEVIAGDARNPEDVRRAIGSASIVVNLAHGGGGSSRAEAEANIVGSALTVADGCMTRNVRRLVHVSSIASLYLGSPSETITAQTGPDPLFDKRADYARAKAIAENSLLRLHREKHLPVCILRPGVVIGAGGAPFHSGIGFFNHENHCMGWNPGKNPLPLVLVQDVAEAIVKALDALGIEGKSYNIVGDVRLNAREYIDLLANATGRPLQFHSQSVLKLYSVEVFKTLIKKAGGRRGPWPSLRDLKSRGLAAKFDIEDARRDLGWVPVRDRTKFTALCFGGHGSD